MPSAHTLLALLALHTCQVIEYLGTLCQTLHHVHCCGVLHRDLKSSNIFVTRNDATVKLGDFGLACTGLSRRRLSGSPRYTTHDHRTTIV